MTPSMSRPCFFPGQMIDYRDFNRISTLPSEAVSELTRNLVGKGGILLQALGEFSVEPIGGLQVTVHPGRAVLPSGDIVTLPEPFLLDLAKPEIGLGTVIVNLGKKQVGAEHIVDSEDPSIEGFSRIDTVAEVRLSRSGVLEGCIELFRVELTSSTHHVRLATAQEEWSSEDLSAGVIDLRGRQRILPLSYAEMDFRTLVDHRTALFSLERTIRNLERLFRESDRVQAKQSLCLLHAELLCVPLQPLKLGFLLSEFAERLGLFLEAIERRTVVNQPGFNRNLYLDILALIASLRSRDAIPRMPNLSPLTELSRSIERLAEHASSHLSFVDAVTDALDDIQTSYFPLLDKISLAGQVFRKFDEVSAAFPDRLVCSQQNPDLRKLSASYRNGESVRRAGVFVRQGHLAFSFKIPNAEQPVVLILPQYIRRQSARLNYRINGKILLSETTQPTVSESEWTNRGLVVRPDALVAGENHFTIEVQDTELDFGFFECALYQPFLQEVEP